MRTRYFAFMSELTLFTFLLSFVALTGLAPGKAQAVTGDINVKLRPVVEKIDLVTDINVIGKTVHFFLLSYFGVHFIPLIVGDSA